MNTLEARNALQVATALSETLPQNTSDTAKLIYKALVWASVETSCRRGHSPNITEAVLHIPLEQVARACGISRKTVYRNLPALQALGVVAYRPHKGTLRGETRTTGCVWRVRLTPRRGRAARLSYDDLKHKWRDLEADVRRGRTSYRTLKEDVSHTTASPRGEIRLEVLLAWIVNPVTSPKPVASVWDMPKRAELEAVLDTVHMPREDRSAAVTLAAEALATALADAGSVDWYRRLLWQLLRRFDATGDDYSYQVYLAAQRARTDAVEGFARRPGALLISRLRAAPWFDEVMNGPPVRVAGSIPKLTA